jgi:chaperonin GroES
MQKIPFKPLADRILLEQIPESQEVTKSGILLLDAGNERPNKSKVIAIGAGKNGIKPDIQVNDIVLHGRSAGFKMRFKEKEFIIIRESDIFGVIE